MINEFTGHFMDDEKWEKTRENIKALPELTNLGTLDVVKVQSGKDYDIVLLEGEIPQGEVMPSNLLLYVKGPHNFKENQKVTLFAKIEE